MSKQLTADDIDTMMLPQLRTLAAEHFDASDIKGLKKAQLVELLKENLDTINGADDELEDEVDDELDDEDDELDDEEDDMPLEKVAQAVEKAQALDKAAPPEPAGDTLTAKQVATRIGTDAKTLRKFFRSPASTVEPAGQGGRYEFDKAQLPKIKAEFEKWNSTKGTRTSTKTEGVAPKSRSRADRAPATAVVEEDEELEIDDEPSADELDELDDLELDDDELDD